MNTKGNIAVNRIVLFWLFRVEESSCLLPSQQLSFSSLEQTQTMLALHLRLQSISISNFTCLSEQFIPSSSSSSSISFPFSVSLGFRDRRSHKTKTILISCKASNGRNFERRFANGDDDDHHLDNYIEAFLMVSETVKHYHLRNRGFVEETSWHAGAFHPFSIQAKDLNNHFSSFGHEFLRRFQSPTIFLKIACDGEFVLPIIVGDFAIEKLIDSLREGDEGDCPDQFQFVKNVVDRLGYEVKMVRITKRIANTYYARIFFSKPGEKAILTVDARPSDAITVAKRCRAPIYVNKQIVLTDAIIYGTRRGKSVKSVYDVSLDSAVEGRDLLAEELHLVRNLNIAIEEERYNDAAILRDKLMMLRKPRYEV